MFAMSMHALSHSHPWTLSGNDIVAFSVQANLIIPLTAKYNIQHAFRAYTVHVCGMESGTMIFIKMQRSVSHDTLPNIPNMLWFCLAHEIHLVL